MRAERTFASAAAERALGEGAVVLMLVGWWLLARHLPEFILPGPLAVARRLSRPRVRLTLVDRAPVVHGVTLERLAALGWHARVAADDVFDFLARTEPLDALFVNLFLHHFDDARLARLLAACAARTRLFVACEPRRSGVALAGSRLLWALGCNDVTRHDAAVSVRAGFTGGEIGALWPARQGWNVEERAAWPFSHLFIACAATRS